MQWVSDDMRLPYPIERRTDAFESGEIRVERGHVVKQTKNWPDLDDVAALPSCRSLELKILAWMRPLAVLVLADIGIRVLHLVEVA